MVKRIMPMGLLRDAIIAPEITIILFNGDWDGDKWEVYGEAADIHF